MPWIPFTLCAWKPIVRKQRLAWAVAGACGVGIQIFAGSPQLTLYTDWPRGVFRFADACGARAPRVARADEVCGAGGGDLLRRRGAGGGAARAGVGDGAAIVACGAGDVRLGDSVLRGVGAPGHARGADVIRSGVRRECHADPPFWGRWNFWETGIYFGVVSLMLVLAALVSERPRRWLPLAVLAGFFLAIAMARYFPAYWVLYKTIPGLHLFRAPARAASVFALPMGLLAGMGLDALLAAETRKRAARCVMASSVSIIAAAVFALASGPSPAYWSRLFNWFQAQGERIPSTSRRRRLSIRDW